MSYCSLQHNCRARSSMVDTKNHTHYNAYVYHYESHFLRPTNPCKHHHHYRRSQAASRLHSTFHQDRLQATDKSNTLEHTPMDLKIKIAEEDEELQAASWLRALSFYAYPPERKFAGELHQIMIAEEEFQLLKAQRANRRFEQDKVECNERNACLVAVASANDSLVPPINEKLYIQQGKQETRHVLVGTLDVHAVRALPGESLIGDCTNAAYLANVCSAPCARRRGVGGLLIDAARQLAREWGADGLYVHTMAVNEIAMAFYKNNGFVVEKEETSNQAHYRGRCLDGIEGRGRSVLLRDTNFGGV